NGVNCRPAMEPLAPTSGIGGAPLSKGVSFLNHAWLRRTNVWRRITSPARGAKRLRYWCLVGSASKLHGISRKSPENGTGTGVEEGMAMVVARGESCILAGNPRPQLTSRNGCREVGERPVIKELSCRADAQRTLPTIPPPPKR